MRPSTNALRQFATLGLLSAVTAQQWVPIDLAPPARQRHGMVTDTVRRRVVMFGGEGREDTWVFDGVVWTQLTTTSHLPQRTYFGCAFDELRGDVVVFGGAPPADTTNVLTDTWRLRGNTWSQVPTTAAPPGRWLPAMAFDRARGEVVMFGGYDPVTGRLLNDTWTWDGATWHARTPVTPAATAEFEMAYDAARQRIVLVNTRFAATWEWDGIDWQAKPAPPMSPRTGAPIVYRPDVQRIVLFGGSPGINQQMMADTWQYDGASWSQLATPTAPPGRTYHGMAWDPVGQRTVVFGGRIQPNLGTSHADTWALTSTGWSRVPLPEQPANVQALAWDSARDRFVALTGNSAPVETWEFDGWWHRVPSTLVPPISWSHQLAFDPLRNVTLTLTPAPDHQTWQWNGAQWQVQPTANRPPSRVQFALAFDPTRGVTVLFGGYSFAYFHDTWEFDGTDWLQRSPPASPPGLQRAAMAFHPASGRMVLFGGLQGPSGPPSDATWEYDGVTWTQRVLAVRPPGRHGAALALDPSTGELVLSGGSSFNGGATVPQVRDAWRWNGSAWTPTPPQGIYAVPWQRAAADAHNAIMSDGERWWRWTSQPAVAPAASGAGCGTPTPALVIDSRPYLGNQVFRMHVEPTLPGVLFALYADTAATTSPLGGGCTQYLLAPFLFALGTTTPSGVGSMTVPIPRLPGLRGCELHLQGLAGQPDGPLQGVAAVTGRVTVVLGD